MKKKFLTVLLAVVAALCLCFGLAACGAETSAPTPPDTQTDPGGTSQEYTITYDANGGAFTSGETFTQKVKENSTLTAPTSPTRQYYTFAGWAKSRGGSELWDFSNDKVTGNTKLYAVWAQKSATILSVEGASIDEGNIFMLVTPQTAAVQLASKVVCSDDSYWQLYYDELGQTEIPTKVAANLGGGLMDGKNTFYILVTSQDRTQVNTYVLTVYRQYTTHVTYRTNGAVYDTKDIVTGTPLTQDYDISCTVRGYTFNGWEHTEKFGENVWGPVTFTADLTANTYKVTFDSAGGSEVAEKTVTFGQSYSFTKLTRTGYTFLGWWAGGTQLTDGDGSVLPAWNIDTDTKVTAHWQVNKYAVTLNRNDNEAGSVSGGGEHDYDSQVTIWATTYLGYTFRGWYDAMGELVTEEEQYTFKMGFAVSYTAKWDYYTLTTTRNNEIAGTLSQSYNKTKVSAGTKVTLTVITNLGYIFDGWYKGEDEVSKDPTYQYTMAKENVSFEARWSLDPVMADYTFTSTSTVCTIKNVKVTGKTEYAVPDYVTTIQQGAFAKCNSIETITIPFVGGSRKTSKDTYQYPFGYIFGTSKTYGYEEVKQYYHGSSTKDTTSTTYYIPSTLKNVILTGGEEILYGAFYNCSGLTSVTIGSSVTEIGGYAFYNCSGLTSITIPDGVTEIGESAFGGCSGLERVNITDLVAWCKIDFGSYTDNPLYYAHHLYIGGEEVTELKIPDGVTEIGSCAFSGCSGLTSIVIPDGVTEIGSYVFAGCSGLTSITIPDDVTSIGNDAFGYCSGLTSITIPDGVTEIGNYAFEDCSGLTSVTIPDGVTSIGNSAFLNCTLLESVVWNAENCTKAGISYLYLIFEGCTKLKTVTFGENVKTIPAYAFRGCSGLTSITIPDGVTEIGSYAFRGCSGLTSIEIPDGVTSIGDETFYNCSGLTSVVIPDGVTEIGSWAFYGCSGLTSVTIGSGVTEIGDLAFQNCSGLESVIWNAEKCTTTGSSAIFKGCTKLKTVTFGENVKTIPAYAFSGCDGLTSAEFKNPNGWSRSIDGGTPYEISSEDLRDPQNAANIIRKYCTYDWKREA